MLRQQRHGRRGLSRAAAPQVALRRSRRGLVIVGPQPVEHGELERAVVDVAEALEREARARMDADTSVEGRMRKLENATLGVAERHAKALETLITYTYPFQQRGVSMS